MYAWYEAVIETNTRFNLTRITEPAEAAAKHFADSLAVLPWTQSVDFHPASVLDVGTGAGFPAAPLAIMRPDWQVVAIDSTGKKARFVSETATRLGIENLSASHARAGQWNPPAPFDLVLFKAVGAIGACMVESRHLVRTGGYVVHYKTAKLPKAEETQARSSLEHGFAACPSFHYTLSLREERMERRLRIYRNTMKAPY